jgi:hypothetical protein
MNASASSQDTIDKLDLMALEAAYCATFDSKDAEGWASLFTADGSFEAAKFERASGGNPTVGRTALVQKCATYEGNSLHLMGLPSFTLSGDQASARITYVSVVTNRSDEVSSTRVTHGYYDVDYLRTSVGWAIHRRVSHVLVQSETQAGPAVTPPLWA